MFKVWIKTEIIQKCLLTEIDKLVKSSSCPVGIGRLPNKMSSNYGNFTAAQWRTWITIYSPVILKTILPSNPLVILLELVVCLAKEL